jgi:hypothetical protein
MCIDNTWYQLPNNADELWHKARERAKKECNGFIHNSLEERNAIEGLTIKYFKDAL